MLHFANHFLKGCLLGHILEETLHEALFSMHNRRFLDRECNWVEITFIWPLIIVYVWVLLMKDFLFCLNMSFLNTVNDQLRSTIQLTESVVTVNKVVSYL